MWTSQLCQCKKYSTNYVSHTKKKKRKYNHGYMYMSNYCIVCYIYLPDHIIYLTGIVIICKHLTLWCLSGAISYVSVAIIIKKEKKKTWFWSIQVIKVMYPLGFINKNKLKWSEKPKKMNMLMSIDRFLFRCPTPSSVCFMQTS